MRCREALSKFNEIRHHCGPKLALECGLFEASRRLTEHNQPAGLLGSRLWDSTRTEDWEPRVLEVPVDRIQFVHRFPFPLRGAQAFVGTGTGSWDRLRIPLDDARLFRSLELRFTESLPWEATAQYRWARKKIEGGGSAWNSCRSTADLKARCRGLEELYADMRENGYRRCDPDDRVRQVGNRTVPDEIRIAVDRNGSLIQCASGRHRLAIAKILDISAVPVIVQLRHTDWNGTVESLTAGQA